MFGFFLPSKGSLPEITLSDLEGYQEDNQTADLYEKKGAWRLLFALLIIGSAITFAWWVKKADLRETEPYRTIEIVSMFGCVPAALLIGLIHMGGKAKGTPISLVSGLPMNRYWRADPPLPVTKQMLFVCHSSKTYFRRNFSGTYNSHIPIR